MDLFIAIETQEIRSGEAHNTFKGKERERRTARKIRPGDADDGSVWQLEAAATLGPNVGQKWKHREEYSRGRAIFRTATILLLNHISPTFSLIRSHGGREKR